ncbi:tetratricopeptide repeat protein [Pyxidicoccus fallax]|uniref:Tetratricopeptide repeat protein n=1 Tax=Pyxidicoccus fallax TaxID=394095 RepID=A0A848LL90_9BACT|nr:tetratricopeptide repeat protein [Pyxidicoccus fallax]NMO18442.1 tetratricopeptide repeat protein [Pyxidicoccus fallax]NPC78879.1 tetratricopeptide repeat protein [Pyxidicoccus fallax]
MSPLREEGEESLDDLLKPLDGGAGPARRIARQKSAALVMAAMEAAREAPARPLTRRRRPPTWLMAAGAVLFASAAAASIWKLASTGEVQTPPVAVSVPSPAMNDEAPAEDVPSTAAPVVPPADEPVREERAGPVPDVRVVEPEAAPVVRATPRADASPVIRKPRPEEPARAPAAETEDLLREANEFRAAGRWKEAEALYLHVIRGQPSSLAAYVARVASGSLRLEHLGDARGALRQFEGALRLQPQGVLDQEARHGIAEAWRALGETDAEMRALEDFLSAHPDSPLAATAQARLRELYNR